MASLESMPAAAMDSLTEVCVVLSVLICLIRLRSAYSWRARSHGLPLPPGPKPLPILGNIITFPTVKPWLASLKFFQQYGDLVYFRVLGQQFLILGSASAITELLEQRSAISSDRVQTPMIELSGSSLNLALFPYGQRWRRHRRSFWQYFHRDAACAYHPTQQAIAYEFLGKLLDDPAHLKKHIRFTFGAAALKTVYGITTNDNDGYMALIDETLEGPAQGLVPGKFLVQFLPFLRYIPPWVPGATSQRLWAKWTASAEKLKNTPFQHTQASMTDDDARSSVVGQLLSKLPPQSDQIFWDEELEIAKNVGAVSLEAGADTSFSTLQAVFLGLSFNPDAVRKAHEELDEVVGPHRLPDHNDRDSLVYVTAIVLEALRWHVVIPMGTPHTTIADQEFRGYFIPAGTAIVPGTWACMHDPEIFPDPHKFRPDRFIRDGQLNSDIRSPTAFIFGFGRRLCPGRYFALDSLFINVACALHVFDISPPVDEHGNAIKIDYLSTDGVVSYPEDCRCTIKPRSAEAEALIREHVKRGSSA